MDPIEADPAPVVVVVTRSGGFAGMRRAWRAAPVDDDVEVFVELIGECPWNDAPRAPAPPPRGADRFVWSIQARYDEDEHEAELPDDDLTGAWRALVDAVRDWRGTQD